MANQYDIKATQDYLKSAEKDLQSAHNRLAVYQELNNQERVAETHIQILRLNNYITALKQELEELIAEVK